MLRTSSAFRPTAIALLLAGSALGGAAHAAGTETQAQAEQGNAVAEVIVTAEKRSENVQNVAAVVDVLDTRALERLNVNGSGISLGHPIGATGCGQLVELVDQLRGRCGARQVEGARIALAENGGGFLGRDAAAMVVTILGK